VTDKWIVAVAVAFSLSLASFASAQPQEQHFGLLLIAHGAPKGMPNGAAWNKDVLGLRIAETTKALLERTEAGSFEDVRLALMESSPSIQEQIKEMSRQGINRFLALPLFITPSGHTKSDIPTILGINPDQKDAEQKQKALKEEGIECIDPVQLRIAVEMGPHLDTDNDSFFEQYVLDSMAEFEDLKETKKGLVILAHGEQTNQKPWEALLGHLGEYLKGRVPNIVATGYGLIGHGDRFATDGASAIGKTAAQPEVEKTVVLGLFLAMSVNDMAQRAGYQMKNVLFSQSRGFILSRHLPVFLAQRANDWLRKQTKQESQH
jgi:hypothetical protein